MIRRRISDRHGGPGALPAMSIGVVVSATLVVTGASAATSRDANLLEERVIAACIHRAARGHGWLEKTLWGLRDQEAGWIGAAIRNANGSYDLGPLQINNWWVPRLAVLLERSPGDVSRWLRSDACFNAEAARWIFLSSLSGTHDYWKAVGLYHSPTPSRQSRYAGQVSVRLRERFGREIFDRAATSRH